MTGSGVVPDDVELLALPETLEMVLHDLSEPGHVPVVRDGCVHAEGPWLWSQYDDLPGVEADHRGAVLVPRAALARPMPGELLGIPLRPGSGHRPGHRLHAPYAALPPADHATPSATWSTTPGQGPAADSGPEAGEPISVCGRDCHSAHSALTSPAVRISNGRWSRSSRSVEVSAACTVTFMAARTAPIPSRTGTATERTPGASSSSARAHPRARTWVSSSRTCASDRPM